MPEMLVIIPSRGRPAVVASLAAAFDETCTAGTMLVFAVDDDDPELRAYAAIAAAATRHISLWINHGRKNMVAALNNAAHDLIPRLQPYAVAFMGDDHRPRTHGWDTAYLNALGDLGTGIVYGDDLLQHDRIPTQVAMTADIPRALGHMAPGTLTHLFVDNYWRDLGRGAGCLHYLPHVIVEHLHPYAGKAEWDAGHRRVNAPGMYRADGDAYTAYLAEHMTADIRTVRGLR